MVTLDQIKMKSNLRFGEKMMDRNCWLHDNFKGCQSTRFIYTFIPNDVRLGGKSRVALEKTLKFRIFFRQKFVHYSMTDEKSFFSSPGRDSPQGEGSNLYVD